MTEIKFRGQYDRKLFFRAVRLANQPVGNQMRFLRIMLLFALGALVLLVFRIVETGDLVGNAILLAAAVIMVFLMVGVFVRPVLTAQKMWADPGTRRKLKGSVSNRGIVYVLEAGRNEIRWERILRVRKSDDLVTLVRNDGLLMVFPRRFFKREADWKAFVKLVNRMASKGG